MNVSKVTRYIHWAFIALWVIDILFLVYLLSISDPSPYTILYGWAPVTVFGLIPVSILFILFHGWLFYRTRRYGEHPYRDRLTRIALSLFIITIPSHFLVAWVVDARWM